MVEEKRGSRIQKKQNIHIDVHTFTRRHVIAFTDTDKHTQPYIYRHRHT